MARIIVGAIVVVALVALLVSRYWDTSGGTGDQLRSVPVSVEELRVALREAPLDEVAITRIVDGGPSVLRFILDDFGASEFAESQRARLARGYNLGRALDQDTYAANVIRVAEAFGPEGVDQLIARIDPQVSSPLVMDSDSFRQLGVGTVKPMLTMQILQGASKEDLSRVSAWLTTYYDERTIREVEALDLQALPVAILVGIAAGLVANAVYDGAKWLVESSQEEGQREFQRRVECMHEYGLVSLREDRPPSSDLVSDSERLRHELRKLDPKP